MKDRSDDPSHHEPTLLQRLSVRLMTLTWFSFYRYKTLPCVWEPHRGTGVNILLENVKYPHNSSYEANCLPWGAIREMDDGILVVESWLMSATEYTSARSSCRREVRNGQTWSIGWSRQAREQATFVLFIFCHEQILYTICVCCSWGGG